MKGNRLLQKGRYTTTFTKPNLCREGLLTAALLLTLCVFDFGRPKILILIQYLTAIEAVYFLLEIGTFELFHDCRQDFHFDKKEHNTSAS